MSVPELRILTGSGRHWDGNAEPVGVFDVKADVFAALSALGVDPAKAQVTRDRPPWYHPGRSGALKLGPKTVLAYFGEIHPATLKTLDVEAPVSAFEIFLDALPPEKKKSRAKPPLARFRSLAGHARSRLHRAERRRGRRRRESRCKL